jgi:hypothetical protein
MPKATKKAPKQKLSPAERSQIAKDRWAKRRQSDLDTSEVRIDAAISQETPIIKHLDHDDLAKWVDATADAPPAAPYSPSNPNPNTAPNPQTPPNMPPYPQNPTPEQPPVSPESKAGQEEAAPIPVAPQLTHVAPKKQKRYTGPKEFSTALKAAESRLGKAINERAEAMGKLAGLNVEIPSLIGIIQALKGAGSPPVVVPYDMTVSTISPNTFPPMPIGYQNTPLPSYTPPNLQAIQAAMAVPPVSRASGGAMQFGPEVLGSLEGPEDDIDQFITGPAAGGSGWIGG